MRLQIPVRLVPLLLVALLTACGGLDSEEQQASDALAEAWSGQKPSEDRLEGNRCITTKWVNEVGLDALVEAKALDEDYQPVGKQPPATMTEPVATAFGEAVATCFDENTLRADLETAFEGVSKKAQDAYIECMDGIDRDLIARAVRDGRVSDKPTRSTQGLDKAVGACQAKVQPAG